MEYLKKNYEVIRLADIEKSTSKQLRVRRSRAIITFDDGYRNNYSVAFPVLKHLEFPAIIFPATKYIGSRELFWFDKVICAIQISDCRGIDLRSMKLRKYLFPSGNRSHRWDAIQILLSDLKAVDIISRQKAVNIILKTCPFDAEKMFEHLGVLSSKDMLEMSQSGLVEIGSHTHGHEILTQISKEEAEQTIIQSIEFITRHTGKTVRAFSYPNGNYNDSIKEILITNKIQYAFTTINGAWNACSDHLEIPRVAVGGFDNKLRFIFHLNGFTAKLSHLKRACSIR
jgi:peptidoglycan/xylan/chitin deacetylase (PgdA/CDA1 family)